MMLISKRQCLKMLKISIKNEKKNGDLIKLGYIYDVGGKRVG